MPKLDPTVKMADGSPDSGFRKMDNDTIIEWASISMVANTARHLAKLFNEAVGARFFKEMNVHNIYKHVAEDDEQKTGRDIVIVICPDMKWGVPDGTPYLTRLVVVRDTLTRDVTARIYTRFGTYISVTTENQLSVIARMLYEECQREEHAIAAMQESYSADLIENHGHTKTPDGPLRNVDDLRKRGVETLSQRRARKRKENPPRMPSK